VKKISKALMTIHCKFRVIKRRAWLLLSHWHLAFKLLSWL